MGKSYLKHKIVHNRKDRELTRCNSMKNCKTINYRTQLNHPNSYYIADDKIATSRILELNNIPVPKSVVIGKKKTSKKHLQFLIKKIKLDYPLVLKPISGTQGYGVHINITNINELYPIVKKLIVKNNFLILEEQVYGENYRIMVLDNTIIDVLKRPLPFVIGNGKSTLKALIRKYNKRQEKVGNYPCHNVNNKYIKKQGYILSDVIPKQKKVHISNIANYHNGSGLQRIALSKIHPDNIKMFKKTNNLLGLTLSGIDYMSKDIAVSYKEHGHIIEVNSGPDIQMHISANKKKTLMIPNKINSVLFN